MSRPTYDQIRERVENRYSRVYWLIFHIIMAVTTVAVVWKIDPTPQDGTPVLAAIWAGIIFAHFVKIGMDELRDRAVERAWQKYGADEDDVDLEKPKRIMRLSDDAEIDDIEIIEERRERQNHN